MLKGTSQQRALVAAAIRYAFIDSTKADSATRTDELIAPIVGDFLSLMKDDDVVVRRLAVAALNAAAQSRPHIIVDKLPLLQPYLYKETEVKKELQREVQMGPWKGASSRRSSLTRSHRGRRSGESQDRLRDNVHPCGYMLQQARPSRLYRTCPRRSCGCE